MPNARPHDHPLTDLLQWKIAVFSGRVDVFIDKMSVNLGGRKELESGFNLFAPPPLLEFEESLQAMRDRLYRDAKERGWEA